MTLREGGSPPRTFAWKILMTHSPIATRRTVTGIPTGRLAVWWVLTSEVFIFGGLIMCFVLYKLNGAPGFEQASMTNTPAGAFNTFVLLTSSYWVVLAHQAAEEGQAKRASKLLWYTVACGLVFLGVKAYEYSHEISAGFLPATNLFWSFYYFMTALHGLHVVAGMAVMAWVASSAKTAESPRRVEYVGMYWHLVDIVWIFLFPLLYLAS